SSQKPVPAATVTVLNEATGNSRTVESDDQGNYTVPFLNPGAYKIMVKANGFETAVRPGVVLNVGDQSRLDFQMRVGAITEEVVGQGGPPLGEVESAVVGTVVNRQFIENMPLNGRSFQSLVSLTPSVVIANTSQSANSPGAQGQFSVNGQRANGN